MKVTMLILLIPLGVVLVAGFVVGLVFFVSFLVKSLGGTTGGWRRLVEVYGSGNPPTGLITKRETIQVGAVTYKRCATLGVADEGLYVSIWRKTALIPWTEFKTLGQATLYWQEVPMLTVGDPAVATMTVPVPVFQAMRGKLPPSLVQGASRPPATI
ncbi:MAG: hypothetical protein FJ276_05730 [Planctomycetes bacterium]|nr:hypothetical protein [Planctomycetota bacterium]